MEITSLSVEVMESLQNMLLPLFRGYMFLSAIQIGLFCAILGLIIYKR